MDFVDRDVKHDPPELTSSSPPSGMELDFVISSSIESNWFTFVYPPSLQSTATTHNWGPVEAALWYFVESWQEELCSVIIQNNVDNTTTTSSSSSNNDNDKDKSAESGQSQL